MDRVLRHETVQGTAEMSEVRAVRCQNSGDRKILKRSPFAVMNFFLAVLLLACA